MEDLDVRVTCPLAHPFEGSRTQLIPGNYKKSTLINDLGETNYSYAVKIGWIVEKEG